MNKITAFLYLLLVSVICGLTIPYFVEIVHVIFLSKKVTLMSQLEIYKWFAIGIIVFTFVRKLIKRNMSFLEVFSHELTHTIVALCFNRRIHTFQAGEYNGIISTSGKNYSIIPIALAPYCLPIFTYLLLSIRWMLDFHGMWFYDIVIGMTACFHYFCFKTQIGNHQTDINQYPLVFSYFYIITAWLINLCIILPSFFPNMNGRGYAEPLYHYGVWSSIYRLLLSWWDTLLSMVSYVVS